MSSSGAHTRSLGFLEVAVGVIGEFVPFLQPVATELIVLGSTTILETLLVPTPRSAGQSSVLRSSVANQQILYGQVVTSGVLQFASAWTSSGGTANNMLVATVSHSLTRKNSAGTAGMPIGGIEGYYINDVFVPVNSGSGGWNSGRGSSNDGTGTCGITKGSSSAAYNPLSGNCWVSFSDGSQTTPDATITDHFSSVPANFIGYGICYSTFTLFASSDQGTYSAAFPAGIQTPSNVKALINGQRVYDPRLDGTNGGTGSQRLSDSTTWTFSANPALCAADYLTRDKTDGGAGYATDQLDWSSVAASANICDESITVPAYGATWSGTAWSSTDQVSRYTFNAILDTAETVDQNIQLFLKSMAGWITVSNGKLGIYAGSDTDSSGTLDESFLAGAPSLTCQVQRQQMWNAVSFTYGAEPKSDYNPGQAQPLYNATYETQDGGVRLLNTDTIPGCNNQFSCQILERIKLKQSRNKMTLQLKCNLKALQLECGDVVDVSISELSLSAAPFRILQLSLGSDYSVVLSLQQEDANTFSLPSTPDDTYVAFDLPSYDELYNLTPAVPSPPTSVAANALSAGVLLTWTAPPANSYTYLSIYRSTTSGSSGFAEYANVVGTSYMDANTTPGTTYWYEIKAVQPYNSRNQTSSFSSVVSATAVTAPDVNNVAQIDGGGHVDNAAVHDKGDWTASTSYAVGDYLKED